MHVVEGVVGYAREGRSLGALSFLRIHNTGDALVIGLPNFLVTIGLVRLNADAGLVGVLTGIAEGVPRED